MLDDFSQFRLFLTFIEARGRFCWRNEGIYGERYVAKRKIEIFYYIVLDISVFAHMR